MRESFTIVDHTSANNSNYIYGNADANEVNYPGEKQHSSCYRLRHCIIISVVTTLTILGVATFLFIRCFPELTDSSVVRVPEEVEPNIASVLSENLVNGPTEKIPTQTTGVTTLTIFDINFMKYLIEPLKYEVFIYLNSDATESSAFYGNVSIELVAKERIKYIVIGASDLGLIAVKLTNLERSNNANEENRKLMAITVNSFDTEKGILVIKVNDYLEPHKRYLLQIEYNGSIHNEPFGLFRTVHSSPTDEIDRILIGTNTAWPFERTIFPCFGLPTQTSIFAVNICRQAAFTTISSSTYSSSIPDSSRNCIWDRFSPTEEMATHLLGFVVSNYPHVQMIKDNGVTITIWHPVNRNTVVTSYLLDIATKLVDIFEDYFGVQLPVHDLNIFCIPSVIPYISAKSGIIFIPDVDTTTMESQISEYQKEKLMRILAAHIVEQWINYFLMFEEEDSWIAESLIQYLEYVAIDTVEPEWAIFEEFLVFILHPEMDTFSMNPNQKSIISSKPSNPSLYPVHETNVFRNHKQRWNSLQYFHDDEEISPFVYSELFAPRRMNKGICFFRMLQHVLTENNFRTSLKKFLEFGKGKIVTGNDLWNIMTAEANNTTMPGYELLPSQMTLKTIVNEWIFNKDYPILKIVRNYDRKIISFEQILDDRDDTTRDQEIYRHIPISFTTAEEADFSLTIPKLWLCQKNQTFPNTDLTHDVWLLFNLQQTSLYRVNHDEKNWLLLKDSFEQGSLSTSSRAQLLSDALYLGLRGHMNYELSLNFTRSLTVNNEKEFIVWYTVLNHFEFVENMMVSINDRTLNKFILMLRRYVKYIISSVVNDITSEQTNSMVKSHKDLILQAYILRWACKVEDNRCIARVRNDFNEWKKKPNPDEENPINPNMRYATLCGMMYHADVSDFEFLFFRYMNTSYTNPNKQIYLKSLYCYKQIDRTINSILADTLLNDYSPWHLSEISNMWRALAENPILSTSPFDYLVKNWKSILKKFSEYTPILINIMRGAMVNISGEEQLKTIFQLGKDDKYDTEYLQDVFTDVTKKAKSRITWKYHELGVFVTWLLKTSVNNRNKPVNNTIPATDKT